MMSAPFLESQKNVIGQRNHIRQDVDFYQSIYPMILKIHKLSHIQILCFPHNLNFWFIYLHNIMFVITCIYNCTIQMYICIHIDTHEYMNVWMDKRMDRYCWVQEEVVSFLVNFGLPTIANVILIGPRWNTWSFISSSMMIKAICICCSVYIRRGQRKWLWNNYLRKAFQVF